MSDSPVHDRSTRLRAFYAALVCGSNVFGSAGAIDPAIQAAFAAVPREPFAGPGPWSITAGGQYVTTPDDDTAFLYQDTLIALDRDRGINIGQPSAHARWLNAIAIRDGDSVLQVGVGTGYYTAIIARLVGKAGRVHGYEIDDGLATRARDALKEYPQATVEARSGIAADLPHVDAIYVCAGITQPSWSWLDALKPGGRLLFPLQPTVGLGGMLLITRPAQRTNRWPATFVSRARFVCCDGQQDVDGSRHLAKAFLGGWHRVASFRTDAVDDTCWFAGDGWWLSTATADDK